MSKKSVFAIFLFFFCMVNTYAQHQHVIYFPFNKYSINSDAVTALSKALKETNGKSIDSVTIQAHCDSIGSIQANDILAVKRASEVKQYLIEHQISPLLFKEVKGYGKRIPINDNSTEALRQFNRRAELLIFAHEITTPAKENPKEPAPSNTPVVNNEIPTVERKALESLRKLISTADVGRRIRLPNLNFYGSRHFVVTESLPTLDTLAAILQSFPEIEVEIQGYVCCVPKGKEAFDVTERKYNLSSTRAQAVYNDLVKNGIAPERLKHKGYGSQPMVEEITDEDKAQNRRVEIKILKR